jgi:hypothetical protein
MDTHLLQSNTTSVPYPTQTSIVIYIHAYEEPYVRMHTCSISPVISIYPIPGAMNYPHAESIYH